MPIGICGHTIQIPGKYEGMSSREMTLAYLKDGGCREWFETRSGGRRKGEELHTIMIRHDPMEGTAVVMRMPPEIYIEIGMESIKTKLRKVANQKGQPR